MLKIVKVFEIVVIILADFYKIHYARIASSLKSKICLTNSSTTPKFMPS